MPEIARDDDPAPWPAWILATSRELGEMDSQGQPVEPDTFVMLWSLLSAVEIERIHRPHLAILNPRFLRATWTWGGSTLAVDVRPGGFELRVSWGCRYCEIRGEAGTRKWVDKARECFGVFFGTREEAL